MLTNHDPSSQRVVFDTLKEYPDMIKIVVYREPKVYSKTRYGKRRQMIDPQDLKNFVANQRSIIRTRVNLSDLIECNQFEYFCTFTFDKTKHDRYNPEHCKQVINRWIRNAKYSHSPNLQYLIVPELHKDGAIHFHALISHYNGKYKNSGKKRHGNIIYNLTGYRAGYSTAVKISGNHDVVARYLKKYITKYMPTFFNKKRYFCSQNLQRPTKKYNAINYTKTYFNNLVYQNEDMELYHLEHKHVTQQT